MVRPGKVVVIPNGVVLPDARPHRVPDSLFRWVAVGRLDPVKDYPTLLCAFALTPDNTRLQIAGSGPEEAALLALASALHVQERVEFSGFQTDVQTSLAAADGFVLASLWEGLPVSVLEASAAGLPVVATNAAGTAEALVEGVTGLLVPVGNSIALSEAMTQVMTMSEEERRRMGENGRSHVAERYSLEKVVDQWERLYFELLRQYRNPSS
jgi:glycosyltransferase involved in cell wall biosynthesis